DLDSYAAEWQRQWDAACLAPDRESDPLLYAQRQNCLERTLVDLRGIIAASLDGDAGEFSGAWNGTFFVWSTPLADCARPEGLRAMPSAPRVEHRVEAAALVTEVHRARAEVRAVLNTGRKGSLDAPFARLDAAIRRLDAIGAAQAAETAFVHAAYALSARQRDA